MNHEGQYKLTSINPRSENEGEQHQVAVDLNFENTVPPGIVREIFSDGQINSLMAGLVDEAERPLNEGVGTIKLDCGFEDGQIRIRGGVRDDRDVWLDGVKIVKFKLTPNKAGTFGLSFQIQAHPGDGDLDKLADVLKEHCLLTMRAAKAAPKDGGASEVQQALPLAPDDGPTGIDDPLYDDVVSMVLDAGQVDEDAIRMNFDIGFERCKQMLDAMADSGFITIANDDGHREVVLKKGA